MLLSLVNVSCDASQGTGLHATYGSSIFIANSSVS